LFVKIAIMVAFSHPLLFLAPLVGRVASSDIPVEDDYLLQKSEGRKARNGWTSITIEVAEEPHVSVKTHEGWTQQDRERLCQGRSFNVDECNSYSCCHWDDFHAECHAGDGACRPEEAWTHDEPSWVPPPPSIWTQQDREHLCQEQSLNSHQCLLMGCCWYQEDLQVCRAGDGDCRPEEAWTHDEPSWVPPPPATPWTRQDREHLCEEGHSLFDENKCNSMGCCQWHDGRCWAGDEKNGACQPEEMTPPEPIWTQQDKEHQCLQMLDPHQCLSMRAMGCCLYDDECHECHAGDEVRTHDEPSWVPPSTQQDREHLCQEQSLNSDQCMSMGCCQWDDDDGCWAGHGDCRPEEVDW